VSEGEAAEGAASRPASRWRRRLGLLAAIVVGLVVALRVALPYALERAVPIGAERFGFDATLDNVEFALLRGHVTLEGLRVAPLAATTSGAEAPDLLRLGRLFVDIEWSGLFGGAIEVAELVLERPELALVRAADGFLELPALPPSTEREEDAPPPSEPGEPMPVVLHSILLRDMALRLVDATGGGDLLDFQLKELGLGDLQLVGRLPAESGPIGRGRKVLPDMRLESDDACCLIPLVFRLQRHPASHQQPTHPEQRGCQRHLGADQQQAGTSP
jgi:hypothetical protein